MIRNTTIIREYVPLPGAPASAKWICSILNRSGMNMVTLANKCHMTRAHVSNLALGKNRLQFGMICAICYATGLDDPDEVWNAVSL